MSNFIYQQKLINVLGEEQILLLLNFMKEMLNEVNSQSSKVIKIALRYHMDEQKMSIGKLLGMSGYKYTQEFELDHEEHPKYVEIKDVVEHLLNLSREVYPKRKVIYVHYHSKNKTLKIYNSFGDTHAYLYIYDIV